MKVSDKSIICVVILIGELLYVPAVLQHRHVHKHHHVHHHNNTPPKLNINEVTTRRAEVAITKSGEHNVHTKRSNNNRTQEEISYTHRPSTINDTRNRGQKVKLRNKGIKKHPKILRFRDDKPNHHVRQHAAKSVTLDCNVKGVSKKILKIHWLYNGLPIENDPKR